MNLHESPKTVFILGAGASVNSGAPLMADFLDKAEGFFRKRISDGSFDSRDFEIVFHALNSMQSMHSKANINLDNVEDVFGAFEIAKLINKLGTFPSEKIGILSSTTARLIAQTLEHSCKFPKSTDRISPTREYDTFIQQIVSLSNDKKEAFSKNNIFVTFNYDICLDFALHHQELPIEYGLNESINSEGIQLLKLHGSINWGICPRCQKISAVDWGRFLTDFREDPYAFKNSATGMTMHFSFLYKSFLACRNQCSIPEIKLEPAIVPPTWNKTNFLPQIANVWKLAAGALSEAEYIYVIGYSLPETDMFFRLLYAIGATSEYRLKRFWVINPDAGAKQRFDQIIGQSRKHRYKFIKATFQDVFRLLHDNSWIEKGTSDDNGVITPSFLMI